MRQMLRRTRQARAAVSCRSCGRQRARLTLDVPSSDLYTPPLPLGPRAGVGAGRAIGGVSSQFVEMLDPDELWALFGHELGHVLADHVLYTTTLASCYQLQGVLPFLLRLPYRAVLAVLLGGPAAELTAAGQARSPAANRSRTAACSW